MAWCLDAVDAPRRRSRAGEEHFGEDVAEGLEEAAPKQRGVVHARSKDAVRKARKLKEARAEGEERQTTKMTQFLGKDGGEKKAPKKPVLTRRRK